MLLREAGQVHEPPVNLAGSDVPGSRLRPDHRGALAERIKISPIFGKLLQEQLANSGLENLGRHEVQGEAPRIPVIPLDW